MPNTTFAIALISAIQKQYGITVISATDPEPRTGRLYFYRCPAWAPVEIGICIIIDAMYDFNNLDVTWGDALISSQNYWSDEAHW